MCSKVKVDGEYGRCYMQLVAAYLMRSVVKGIRRRWYIWYIFIDQ